MRIGSWIGMGLVVATLAACGDDSTPPVTTLYGVTRDTGILVEINPSTAGSSTLSGLMAGNWFTATGTITCSSG